MSTGNHELIMCIVNTGFSETVMEAAKDAGARGGTILNGRGTANKEAELIIAEAKARAVREVENTKREAEDLRAEIEQLKQLRNNYFIRCRALIRGQEELLAAMENDQRMDPPQPVRPAAAPGINPVGKVIA